MTETRPYALATIGSRIGATLIDLLSTTGTRLPMGDLGSRPTDVARQDRGRRCRQQSATEVRGCNDIAGRSCPSQLGSPKRRGQSVAAHRCPSVAGAYQCR